MSKMSYRRSDACLSPEDTDTIWSSAVTNASLPATDSIVFDWFIKVSAGLLSSSAAYRVFDVYLTDYPLAKMTASYFKCFSYFFHIRNEALISETLAPTLLNKHHKIYWVKQTQPLYGLDILWKIIVQSECSEIQKQAIEMMALLHLYRY